MNRLQRGARQPGAPLPGPGSIVPTNDSSLIEALRAGDEASFAELVDCFGGSMRRAALRFVRNPEVADESVQGAWLAVLRGIDTFEARSSLKTWLFRIVANIAITRAKREARSVPFSSLAPDVQASRPSTPSGSSASTILACLVTGPRRLGPGTISRKDGSSRPRRAESSTGLSPRCPRPSGS